MEDDARHHQKSFCTNCKLSGESTSLKFLPCIRAMRLTLSRSESLEARRKVQLLIVSQTGKSAQGAWVILLLPTSNVVVFTHKRTFHMKEERENKKKKEKKRNKSVEELGTQAVRLRFPSYRRERCNPDESKRTQQSQRPL